MTYIPTPALADFYKIHHVKMFPDNMLSLYSNFTPRKSRLKGIDKVVVFGIQHIVITYLIEEWNTNFFYVPLDKVLSTYKRHCNVDASHIERLHKLGYLPLKVKALPEGSLCPIGVPLLTVTNTVKGYGWLVNYIESALSTYLWQMITSATIALEYRKILEKYAKKTDKNNLAFVDWQGHDFSMRGMSSIQSAIYSGMGHLISFTGTDTIPAIYQVESSYPTQSLIGASIPATEHSVMCMGTKEDEVGTFSRLLDLYPTGPLSVVSDTWDLWEVLTMYLPKLKEKILARDGKLVIRPDSGDPVDIICGHKCSLEGWDYEEYKNNEVKSLQWNKNQFKGVVELLWDVFGGTVNDQGYKVLDSHIGCIYGDSITLERAEQICKRLEKKGFASTNVVYGIGSYTYQYNTRDTFGFAMKATHGSVLNSYNEIEEREIYKSPVTDSGEKKSAKGLLQVYLDKNNNYALKQQCSKEEEDKGELKAVFYNGVKLTFTGFHTIRERLK